MPNVKGRVIEVPVVANAPLKEGDVLFKIDPRPYQFVVDQKTAQLAEAEQTVKQLKAAYDQAASVVEKVKVQLTLAQENYDRQAQLFEKKVIAQAALDVATRNIDAASCSSRVRRSKPDGMGTVPKPSIISAGFDHASAGGMLASPTA
jgi:multidrug resistance efflux pump